MRPTILVVDDDPQFRELYQSVLRFEGYDVTGASDGLGALQVIEEQLPSLVILDLDMPRVDGWSVLRELAAHESTRSIPVIIVTGLDVTRSTVPVAAVLKKPVAPEDVLPLINAQLRGTHSGTH